MSKRSSAILLVAALLLFGCDPREPAGAPPDSSPEPGASPATGGRLVVGVYGEPATFDPHSPLASDLTVALARPLYRSLYRFDSEGKPVPDLAARIRISGDLATVRLRQVAWSDGRQLTARDVVSSLRRAGLDGVEEVRRQDRRTVLLAGRIDDWPALLARDSYVLPARGRAAYSGPFSLAGRIPGLQVVLRPNPGAEEPPLLDRLTIRFTEGVDMLLALLEAGDIDVAWLPSSVNIAARLDELGVEHDERLGWETVVLDLGDSDLTPAQRRAVAHAIDRARMAEAFVRDHGRVADTLAPDPTRDGASGPFEAVFRGGANVDDVALRLAAPSGDELLELIQRLGQVMLDSAGFDVELINVDARRFYGEWAVEAPVDVAVRRQVGLAAAADDGSDAARTLHRLPLFQVDTVVAWTSGAGGVTATAAPEGPLADAHRWHVLTPGD